MAPPRQGTGFINWGNYVNANQGTLGRMADELSNPLAASGQASEAKLDELIRQFDGDVTKAMAALQMGPLPASTYPEYSGIRELDAPLLEREKELERIGNTAYTGPRSIADVAGYGEASGQADKVSAQARGLADIYGRTAALGERYGKGGNPYTGGARMFDSALLQSSGAGQQRFEGLRNQYGAQSGSYKQALTDTAGIGQSKATEYGGMAQSAKDSAKRMADQRAFQTNQMDAWANRHTPQVNVPEPRTPMEIYDTNQKRVANKAGKQKYDEMLWFMGRGPKP